VIFEKLPRKRPVLPCAILVQFAFFGAVGWFLSHISHHIFLQKTTSPLKNLALLFCRENFGEVKLFAVA
jgi:hypothetical protein